MKKYRYLVVSHKAYEEEYDEVLATFERPENAFKYINHIEKDDYLDYKVFLEEEV